MFVIGFCYGERRAELSMERGAQLRDVQQDLCRLFGQRFPWMKASLTIGGVTYDEFIHYPFADFQEEVLHITQ